MACGSAGGYRPRKGRERSRGEGWGSFCGRDITVPALFSLAKRQRKAGVIEEYKIMNDTKKLNRE